jgi:hypothetical protein
VTRKASSSRDFSSASQRNEMWLSRYRAMRVAPVLAEGALAGVGVVA